MRTSIIALAALIGSTSFVSAQDFAPTFNWSGVYLGANVGHSWGDVSVTDTTGGVAPGPYDYAPKGFSGGLQIGAQQQLGFFVVGAELEGGYMRLNGTGYIPSSTPGHHQDLDLSGGWYGMATGRVGVALNRTLLYGKGGYAYWDAQSGQTTTKPGFVTNRTAGASGFVYGAGIEQALVGGWSIKAEWLRFDFGTRTGDQTSVTDIPIGFRYENETRLAIDTVKLGLNWKF